MDRVRRAMEGAGIPSGDSYDLPTSGATFPDGAHYRIEISGIERLTTLEAALDEMHKQGTPVHRLISTVLGATLLTTEELRAFARTAAQARVEIIITPGPRPQWDLGKQIATPEGAVSGLRIRGCDNLRYLLCDIYRCLDLGFRGFLVWDEGVLSLLSELRDKGEIPKETVFKVSIFAGHANPAGARVLERLGANTFNPVVDLTLPMLAAVRKVVRLPMDLHVYLFESFGGQNRMWETPELARVASPCYFKIEPGASVGALYKPWVDQGALAAMAREKVRQAKIINEIVSQVHPELHCSALGPADLAIPRA
ncbi:MAG: hypothetical protein K6T75_11040 [Acetobacteraceae bacterium]|nr:hypothetical protein [Acetobacteraceae bacterium]